MWSLPSLLRSLILVQELRSGSKALTSWISRVNSAIKSHPPSSFAELLTTAASIYKNKSVCHFRHPSPSTPKWGMHYPSQQHAIHYLWKYTQRIHAVSRSITQHHAARSVNTQRTHHTHNTHDRWTRSIASTYYFLLFKKRIETSVLYWRR